MKYKTVGTCLFFFLLLLVNGCSGFTKRVGNNTTSSSLTDFLYPNNQQRIAQSNQIPQINLPTSIGIAFLPSRNWHNNSFDTNTEYQLLEKVKKRFTPYPFIERIKIIPSTYLRHDSLKGSSGFDTLNQVARLHNVDLIALVSYDQLTQSKQNNASLFYWTIVGMYVIPGNENTIQTFVDTAIFDVKSRKLLMRTPGVNKLDKLSTLVEVDH